MDENEQKIPAEEIGEDVAIMPEGYTDDMDIFSMGEDTGNALEALLGEERTAASGEGQPAAEAAPQEISTGTNTDSASTTGTEENTDADELHFTARVDHADRDVTISKSELPEMYQKAQALDRVQGRLNAMKPEYDRLGRVAKALGYSSPSEMLDASVNNFRDSEIARLTGEGVHPDMAKDYVDRIISEREENHPTADPAQAPQQEQATPKPEAQNEPTRDFAAEVKAVLDVYPDMSGKQLPPEVVNESIRTGKPLLNALTEYRTAEANKKIAELQKKTDTLSQNADAAGRAPVKPVTATGATGVKPEDAFLKGFNSI